MKYGLVVIVIFFAFTFQRDIQNEKIFGKWKVVKVDYLDREPVREQEGQDLVFEFLSNGVCKNLRHNSEVKFSLDDDQLDMGGYTSTIEKLTDDELVFRENKHFFVRRFYCRKIQ